MRTGHATKATVHSGENAVYPRARPAQAKANYDGVRNPYLVTHLYPLSFSAKHHPRIVLGGSLPRRGCDLGFTLIELLVTIAIGVILLTAAIPGFQEFFRNNRLATQSNEFVSSLNLAKSEAVRRGVRVTVCKTSDQANCSTAANWEQGWIVFADYQDGWNGRPGVAGTIQTTASGKLPADQIIRASGPLNSSELNAGDAFSNWITFLPDGSSRGNENNKGDEERTFELCNSNISRIIIVNRAGRINISAGTCTTS